jgi:hydroxylamine reductase (hybrid-cluster protein)
MMGACEFEFMDEEDVEGCSMQMTENQLKKLLAKTLLRDGVMHYSLYEYELEESLEEFKSSLEADQDDYIFSVTENSGHIAMVLIDKSGQVYINEHAREKLRTVWKNAYKHNMRLLIPTFARQLHGGVLPINGVKQLRH